MSAVAYRRMCSQGLIGDPAETPEEVVRRLGAVQSQDFAPGKWAIAQRTRAVTDSAMDQAVASGTILRTHVLRPTWHFVLPADIRWMLELTAPRIHALSASYYRNQGLNETIFGQCHNALENALRNGQHLSRKEIADALDRVGIKRDSQGLGTILLNAELYGLVCSGIPRGKQQTYALLEERAPHARRLGKDEALAELALRYFTGHGPATVRDLRWWSSLTLADITRGLEMTESRLEHEVIDGETYWFVAGQNDPESSTPLVHLIQGYDEYIVGYGESKYLIDESGLARSRPRARGIYTHSVILDGQIAGEWRPVPKRHGVTVDVSLFIPFQAPQMQALQDAVQRYGEYLEVPSALTIHDPR